MKAIAGGLSQKAIPFTNEDKRDLLDEEDYEGQEYTIDYTFLLSDSDIKLALNTLDSSVKVVRIGDDELSLWDLFKNYFSRGIYSYDFQKMTNCYMYYTLPDYTLLNLVNAY